MEEHAAPGVIGVTVLLRDEHQLRIRIRHIRAIGHGETGKAGFRGDFLAGLRRGVRMITVPDVKVSPVRGVRLSELGVKQHVHQAAVIPPKGPRRDVQEHPPVGRGISKGIHDPVLLEADHFACDRMNQGPDQNREPLNVRICTHRPP